MNIKTVRVINNVDIFDTLLTPRFINNREGVNPFEIVEENSMNFLVVENRTGAIKLQQNKLTLDYGIAPDDIGYIFERQIMKLKYNYFIVFFLCRFFATILFF